MYSVRSINILCFIFFILLAYLNTSYRIAHPNISEWQFFLDTWPIDLAFILSQIGLWKIKKDAIKNDQP